jgi:hypothetical protein
MGYGLDGRGSILNGAFLHHNFQWGSVAHETLSLGIRGQSMKLIIHLHLMPTPKAAELYFME